MGPMVNAQSIILHHFERSPFSEKIRLALRMKNLGWAAVEVPSILPKPDLLPLTGGYRRTPVLQIGADIYCDTALMVQELERRYHIPTLTLPGHEGLASMVAAWTDGRWFQTSVGVVFGAIGDQMPQAFIEDRTKMSGRPFDIEAMRAAMPTLQDHWRSQLMWIEDRLTGGRQAGTGSWLVGSKPGLIDVHAYMNPWFIEKNVPEFLQTCFDSAPLTKDWYQRLKAFTGPEPQELTSQAALDIAMRAAPRLKPASTRGEMQAFEPGDRVAVAPDDYAKDWVEGDLVIANRERIILARQNETVDTIHVHFPRIGYVVRKLD